MSEHNRSYRMSLGIPRSTLDAYDTDGHPMLIAILSWWLLSMLDDGEAMSMIRASRGLVTSPHDVVASWKRTLETRTTSKGKHIPSSGEIGVMLGDGLPDTAVRPASSEWWSPETEIPK